jgi:FixJ family two-component response regulator
MDMRFSQIIQGLLKDNYLDEIMSDDFKYCLYHIMSPRERQVIEHLVEGYEDKEIMRLMKITYCQFHHFKTRAKRKLLHFLGS